MKNNNKKKEAIMNDLYDLIKVCGLSKNQHNKWAELSKQFGKEAQKNFKKLLYKKNIEVNHNVIKIGRDITLTIT